MKNQALYSGQNNVTGRYESHRAPEPFRRSPAEIGIYRSALTKLEAYETSATSPPDGRRVIQGERQRLMAQWQTQSPITDCVDECMRVLEMWRGK